MTIRLLYTLKNRSPHPPNINICDHLGDSMFDSGALPRTGRTDGPTLGSLLCTLTPTHVTRLHGPHLMVLRVLRVRRRDGREDVSACLIVSHFPRPRPILVDGN